MRKLFGLLLIIMLSSCENNDKELLIDDSSSEFRNITQTVSTEEFENIKIFILENGDKQTYSNMYNNNPHFTFDGFNAYLNPEIGQANINCDLGISDFNEIVIRDQNSDPQYYHIHIVRQGDIKNEKITVPEGMKEKNVYLLRFYDYDLDLMETSLYGYIELIRNEINNN